MSSSGFLVGEDASS